VAAVLYIALCIVVAIRVLKLQHADNARPTRFGHAGAAHIRVHPAVAQLDVVVGKAHAWRAGPGKRAAAGLANVGRLLARRAGREVAGPGH